jgi:ribosomal protein L11 methyltransferase
MTTKIWYEAICIADENKAELIANLFQASEALSVTFTDGSANRDDARFADAAWHDTQLWTQTRIIALFNQKDLCQEAIQTVTQFVENCPAIEMHILEEKNWVHEGQKNFPTKIYGQEQLAVFPSWDAAYQNCEHDFIRLDPGLAFGTGTHPTTHLCLEWVATHELNNKTIFDFGCGSGILSLAALAKGASSIVAIDHDEQAIIASKQNLDLNAHINPELLSVSTDWPAKTFDLILANVLANPLIEFADRLIAALKPGGHIILSGLLAEEKTPILKAYRALSLVDIKQEDEWLLIELRKDCRDASSRP